MNAMKLKGKKAFVTGGRSGIGRGIVDAFIAQGAEVTTCGRGASAEELPSRCHYFQLDISDPGAAQILTDHFSTLDILVNNAGVQIEKTVIDTTDEDWNAVMGTNAYGTFLTCRALLPVLQTGGSVINIGSISGHFADPSMALYNASKAFVHGLTRSIAVDHGPNIRCNAICPGWIETGMLEAGFDTANDPQAAQQDARRRHPVGRFGQPQDIAAMAVWLASDDASFATGQMFTIDGGMSAASPLNPGLF